MKTIGLLGGITCESSLLYYKLINEMTRAELGGHHAAKSVMVSVDFAEIQPLTERGAWDEVLAILLKAARDIERGGADLLLLCANTAHKLAAGIEREIGIPIVHIVDATAREITKAGCKKVGLLGTRFTMEEEFFSGRLSRQVRRRGAHAGQGRPRARAPHHHRRAGPGERQAGVPGRGFAGHRRTGRARGPGHRPGLHRAAAAGHPGRGAPSRFSIPRRSMPGRRWTTPWAGSTE